MTAHWFVRQLQLAVCACAASVSWESEILLKRGNAPPLVVAPSKVGDACDVVALLYQQPCLDCIRHSTACMLVDLSNVLMPHLKVGI